MPFVPGKIISGSEAASRISRTCVVIVPQDSLNPQRECGICGIWRVSLRQKQLENVTKKVCRDGGLRNTMRLNRNEFGLSLGTHKVLFRKRALLSLRVWLEDDVRASKCYSILESPDDARIGNCLY